MSDPTVIQLAERVCESCMRGEEIEVFGFDERTSQFKVQAQGVGEQSESWLRGLSIRLVDRGKCATVFTTDLSAEAIDETLERARSLVEGADPGAAYPLSEPASYPEVDGLWDDELAGLPAEWGSSVVAEIEERARTANGRIREVPSSSCGRACTQTTVANSRGARMSYETTDVWISAMAVAENNGSVRRGTSFRMSRSAHAIDVDGLLDELLQRTAGLLDHEPCSERTQSLVFLPAASCQLLSILSQAFVADGVAALTKQQTANPKVTIVDDGKLPGGLGSGPCDVEGTPRQSTTVVFAGEFRSPLHHLRSAARHDTYSTGNAMRENYRFAVKIRPSNLYIESTGHGASEVRSIADTYFLVVEVRGIRPIGAGGEISALMDGWLIRDGAPQASLIGVPLTTTSEQLLQSIQAVADDYVWLPFSGFMGGSTMLCDGVRAG